MYRINVLDGGLYNSVVTGCRYAFSKKKIAKALAFFEGKCECECKVEKWGKVVDLWAWVDFDAEINEYLEKHPIKGYNVE